MRSATLLKGDSKACFPVKFLKFLKTLFKNICERQLLTVIDVGVGNFQQIEKLLSIGIGCRCYFATCSFISQLTFTCSKSTTETLRKRCEICSKLTVKS